jgi:hypothetical protein
MDGRVMPVDLLDRVRQEIEGRLRELRPLVAEYEGLLEAAAALEERASAGRGRTSRDGAAEA